jgi:hypothetical protein
LGAIACARELISFPYHFLNATLQFEEYGKTFFFFGFVFLFVGFGFGFSFGFGFGFGPRFGLGFGSDFFVYFVFTDGFLTLVTHVPVR